MAEHDPWIGNLYQNLPVEEKIALVGYSHYYNEENGKYEGSEATIKTIDDVISGREKIAFFTQLRNYFGFTSHADFWPRVIFFNFLPDYIGTAGNKFGTGSNDQHVAGGTRLKRIIGEYKPSRTFIFSTKAWNSAPEMIEPNDKLTKFFEENEYGHYDINDQNFRVFGLRHPQGASHEIMQSAVSAAMKLRNDLTIIKTPGTLGGRARFEGTRTAVWHIIAQKQAGKSDQDILDNFDNLTAAHIEAATKYYKHNMAEIDHDIRANEG